MNSSDMLKGTAPLGTAKLREQGNREWRHPEYPAPPLLVSQRQSSLWRLAPCGNNPSANVVIPPSAISTAESLVPRYTNSGPACLAFGRENVIVQPSSERKIVGQTSKKAHGSMRVTVDQTGHYETIGAVYYCTIALNVFFRDIDLSQPILRRSPTCRVGQHYR